MKLGLFVGRERGLRVLEQLIKSKEEVVFVFCLADDKHEEPVRQEILKLAKKHKIPCYFSDRTPLSSYPGILKKHKPEAVFVVNWRQFIPKENFSIPSRGIFVIHDSLLPRYRGFAPLNWAIINGEKNTGATLFRIAEGIDSGDILDQIKIPIKIDDDAAILYKKTVKAYLELITKNLPRIKRGKVKGRAQKHNLATYTCKRMPQDGKINWSAKTIDIYNLIRALCKPFPGAYSVFNGKKIMIWQAKLIERPPRYAGRIPGRVVKIFKNRGIWALTGDGLIEINKVQIRNGALQTADRIIKSIKSTLL